MGRGTDLSAEERAIAQRNLLRFRQELAAELGEDISQQALAEMAGLSLDAVRGYEQGRRAPDRAAGLKLCAVFGRAFEDIFSEDPPPPDPSRRPAVRTKITGRLDNDLHAKLMDFVTSINKEQLARAKKIKDSRRSAPKK